ncbi:MAG: hypothetical protein CL859_01155 [Cyanobium sp. ARS6]|jgi:uncharacterized protein involved in tolerance to divalent cations|nr:hypothetical protein [Cyanobium sp. ARS6]
MNKPESNLEAFTMACTFAITHTLDPRLPRILELADRIADELTQEEIAACRLIAEEMSLNHFKEELPKTSEGRSLLKQIKKSLEHLEQNEKQPGPDQ